MAPRDGSLRHWCARRGSAALFFAGASALLHGCTYVACAGFAGGVLFVSFCLPAVASVLAVGAIVTTVLHRTRPTRTSRTLAALSSVSSIVFALGVGAIVALGHAELAGSGDEFPEAMAELRNLTVWLGAGVLTWLGAGVVCLVVTLRAPLDGPPSAG